MASNQEKDAPSRKEPKYHIYVRVPFNRGDFVDPPPVDWDETKSEALWSIISKVAKAEIDWAQLAATFGVTVEFLLQMASYLTEHHTSQLRAQMRKAAATKGSSAPSPIPGSEPGGPGPATVAEGMRRTASGGGRAPSSLSIRKDSPLPKNDGSLPDTPIKTTLAMRPQGSRNSSSNTTILASNQTAGAKGGPRPGSPRSHRHRLSSFPISPTNPEAAPSPEPTSPGSAGSSSPESSSSSSPVESRIIRRPPRFQPHEGGGPFADDEEAEPAFLPFKPQASGGSSGSQNAQDLGATLRGDPRDFAKRLPKGPGRDRVHHSQTSDSSTSSAAVVSRRPVGDRKPSGPLSPRRTTELSGRSAGGGGSGGGKGKGYSRDGSDGTPSMGSSFSDLDDASVTQSALEEALASKMQDGGTIGSRMSTISQAIRSRYLPKTNNP